MKTQHTRKPLGRSISLLFAAAAIMAIGAEGFLAAPAAHAESCTVNGSQLQLRVHPDFTYTVTVGANGSTLAGEVFSTVAGQDGVSGNATGSIAGNAVDFIVNWNPADGGGTTHFRGTVGADGVATGTATGASAQDLNKHLEFAPGPWESVAPLTCPAVGAPAAQAPAAQPKQGPTVTPEPGLTGVTFHITDRSGVASQCTYSSEGFQSSFGLPANGTFDLDVPAIRLLKNRTGKVTCDNGTSTNTSVFY
jgi:hypothetical protein